MAPTPLCWLAGAFAAIAVANAESVVDALQVTSKLALDASSLTPENTATYPGLFLSDLSAAIDEDPGRLSNPVLTPVDATTSQISFTILPPTARSMTPSVQIGVKYNLEIQNKQSPFRDGELAQFIDPLSPPTVEPVQVKFCDDGSFVGLAAECPQAVPSFDATLGVLPPAIAILALVVAIVAIIACIMVVVYRRKHESAARGPLQTTTDVDLHDNRSGDSKPPSPVSQKYSQAPPVQSPFAQRLRPVQQLVIQEGQESMTVDAASVSTTSPQKAEPSRIIKKGMGLKTIRQKRMGLNVQIDQLGNESMPDTDTEF